MIVVVVVGMLVAISVPAMVKYRNMAQVRLCISNLRNLDHAKQSCAIERQIGTDVVPVESDVQPYLQFHQMPICPASGTYRLRRMSLRPVCTLYPLGHTLSNGNLDEDALPE